jgi:hypothetical protein
MLGTLSRVGQHWPKGAGLPVALSQPSFVIGQSLAAEAGV